MIFKKVFRLFLSLTLLFYSPFIWSQQVGAPPKASASSSRTTSFNNAPSVQADAKQKFNSALDNSKNQAKKASDDAGKGSNQGATMGLVCAGLSAAMFAIAYATAPANGTYITLGILFAAGAVLGMLTAGSMNKAKGQADNSVADFSPNIPGGPNSPYKGGDMPPETQAKIDDALKKLKGAGVKVDLAKGTFSTPDGKNFSATDVANGNAGLPGGASAFNKLMDQAKTEAEKKLAAEGKGKASDSDSELAGTGGGQKVVTLPDESAGAGAGGDNANKNARDLASVDGAGKMYNGELIGVAADKIFSIVCRRTIKEVEKGKTMEGAVGRKPGDCDRYSAMSVQSKDAPIKVQTATSAPN
jgi:hypothetical protein